jgi:hypothetical protein
MMTFRQWFKNYFGRSPDGMDLSRAVEVANLQACWEAAYDPADDDIDEPATITDDRDFPEGAVVLVRGEKGIRRFRVIHVHKNGMVRVMPVDPREYERPPFDVGMHFLLPA